MLPERYMYIIYFIDKMNTYAYGPVNSSPVPPRLAVRCPVALSCPAVPSLRPVLALFGVRSSLTTPSLLLVLALFCIRSCSPVPLSRPSVPS